METIDNIFKCLGLMDFEKCHQACEYLRRIESGEPKTFVQEPIDFRIALESVADIFKTYGPRMNVLKASFQRIADKNTILAISKLFQENFPRLQHFYFSGSSAYPDISNTPSYLPNLSHLRSLKMSNFSRFTGDNVVANYLNQAYDTLHTLTLERMTINGSCLNNSPSLKTLGLRSLTTLNVNNVHRFLTRCYSLISFTLEMPGFESGKNTQLLAPNMMTLRILKLNINNRLPFMERIDVLPITNMPSLTTLELEIFSMNGLNQVIQQLAKYNTIERLVLTLNDFLEKETINTMFHFSKLRSVKLIVDKQKKLSQLYQVIPYLTHDNKLTTFELVVCAFDASTLCHYIHEVKHLVIRVNGPLDNMYTFTLLSDIKTIDLTMRLHDRFFFHSQHDDTLEMLCTIATMNGIAKLTLTLLTASIDEPTLEEFRKMASKNDLQLNVTEDLYAVDDVTCNLQFDVEINDRMQYGLMSLFETMQIYQEFVLFIRLVIETGDEPILFL